MRGLLFISRVALVCNVCYLVMLLGRYVKWMKLIQKDVIGTIVVLGLVAVFLNIFVNLIWLVTVALKKKGIPRSIGVINLVFLIFQLLISIFQL